MAFPNVSDGLQCFLQDVILREVTQSTSNFDLVETFVDVAIRAVIQPESGDRINKDIIDWDLDHIFIHSEVSMKINDRVVWNDKDYKIIQVKNYSDYGYFEAIGEEQK